MGYDAILEFESTRHDAPKPASTMATVHQQRDLLTGTHLFCWKLQE